MKFSASLIFSMALLLLTQTGLVMAVPVNGDYSFSPHPSDLQDLNHNYYYSWEINWDLPSQEQIIGAQLSITNINNWNRAANILYVHLFDTPPTLNTRISSNVTRGYDNEGGGDNFLNQGILLTTYTDANGWPGPAENWTYNLTMDQLSILQSYVQDGLFGLGFDPDCSFYNCGIRFDIQTNPVVPEPATMTLCALGLGLGGIIARRRMRHNLSSI